jgi:GlpG protein
MRRIWTSTDRTVVDHFSQELSSHEITHSVDTEKDLDWGSETYGSVFFSIWAHDDADVERAKALLTQLSGVKEEAHIIIPNASSNSPLKQFLHQKFHIPFDRKAVHTLRPRYLTIFIVLVCSLLLAFDHGEKAPSLPPHYTPLYAVSPVQQALLFDYPHAAALENRLITTYGPESLESTAKLNAEADALRSEFLNTPYWGGFCTEMFLRLSKSDEIPTPSVSPSLLCERIRDGQIWRFFTPCLLHANILHLVFNLLWIIALGSQIERTVSPFRYGVLIVIIGIVSNTAQYLMTGPSFLGISGVICGMAGFIAARQKVAPWEAYAMSHMLYSCLLFFIWTLVALGGVAFVLESYLHMHFVISFANTAHLTGLGVGLGLGRMRWFRLSFAKDSNYGI